MPELCVAKIIYVFYLLITVAKGSSLYKEYSMDSEKICHPLARTGDIKISDADDAGVIVRPIYRFEPWDGVDKMCKFVLQTHRHTGLFAVVQNMSLRRNGSQCIDYIQFKEDGRKSKWFCGELDYGSMRYHSMSDSDESSEVANFKRWNSSRPEFKSSKGEIETQIFISKAKLLPREILNLTIVYTPYKDCDKLKDKSKYRLNSNNTCISASYYCDGRRNCAFDNCLDEVGCGEIVVSNGTGTKVTVGAVTTLFLSFLLFVMCLWTCRKHKKLCWSPDCAGPNTAGTHTPPIDLRTRDSSGRSVVPSAPMLDEATARPVHDKDLPPSYDSLFPEQSIPATT